MAPETRVLELVQFGDNHGYPVYWIVNWSDRGMRTLTFWAGSLGLGANPHQQASGIPPRSRVKVPATEFVEPGWLVSVVEEVVWEDGTIESFFRLPITQARRHACVTHPACDEEEFIKLNELNAAVRVLQPLHSLQPEHHRREVQCGLRKAMGLPEWESGHSR